MGGHTSPALTGPPEAGGRLIGGAGAVAPAGRPKADLWPMFPHWENFFQKKYQKIWNVHFWVKNQSCSRRNSAHFGTHTVPWGPLFDHFPGFNNFVKICQNGPIPQTVQIWPSGQASGLGSQTPGVAGSIPGVCSNLRVSGAARRLFPREK